MTSTIIGSGLGRKAVSVDDVDNFLDWLVNRDNQGTDNQALYARVAWTFWCVNLRANSIAKIPYKINRLESPEDDPVEFEGWDIDLTQMLWDIEAWLSLVAAGYVLKRENGAGVQALQVLNANTMSIEAYDADGPTVFKQRVGSKPPKFYRADQILYFRTFNPKDDIGPGVSSGDVAQVSGALVAESNAWAAKFFANGAIPAVFLTADGPIPKGERDEVRNRWNRMLQGVTNAFKTLVLGSGLKPTIVGQPIGDLAMPELAKESREQILGSHLIPPGLAEAKTNRAERDSLKEELYTDAIIPEVTIHLKPIIDEQLLNPLGLRIDWDFSAIEAIQRAELAKAESMSFIMGDVMLPAYEANVVSIKETRATIDDLLGKMDLTSLEESFIPEERAPAPMLGVGEQTADSPGSPQSDDADKSVKKKPATAQWGVHRVSLQN